MDAFVFFKNISSRNSMKFVLSIFTILTLYSFVGLISYDTKFVEKATLSDNIGHSYDLLFLKKTASQSKIKTKYFGETGSETNSISERYLNWVKDKSIIYVTDVGFVDRYYAPVGLSIENGKLLNRNLEHFDGLVIIFPSGGLIVTNLDSANFRIPGRYEKTLDIRGSLLDKENFIEWAEKENISAFQTQLLAFNDVLQISPVSDSARRERRFLAICRSNQTGEIIHAIVNSHEHISLFSASLGTKKILNEFADLKIEALLNVDRGIQYVSFFFNEDGTVSNYMRGNFSIKQVTPLLAYYYQ